ncbi:PucR family transcriptional regulator [Agromyces aerolatus]|uniref:PucR family transcriptional regulator n=1 Tax=Agromyces sp. LY-1074 TaxID=3074080 RepID=UPI002867ABCA|nr:MULTISPECIES: PucR family transcriptional regulator [unclassified Agromyces]MDR5701647.1 PucR family transcriptional regulator [Agromyces sp. LY-1074]MDR5707913.1 PucR family transcriptional regulator [Agromyces sp. LY-1358]
MLDVAWLLTLPAIRRGIPHVVSGADRLATPVRWLHVGEMRNISHYLKGGEALLTSGQGFGTTPEERREYLRSLADCDVAALILELKTVYEAAPHDVVEECDRLGIPLITLDRPVAFVEASQEAHSALVDESISTLTQRNRLAEVYAEALLDGASLGKLVDVLSDQTGNPAILRDHAGALVAAAARGVSENELVLAERSMDATRWIREPLPGKGNSGWHVHVLPLLSRIGDHDRLAAKEAARAIALTLTSGRFSEGKVRREPHGFLLELLDERAPSATAALHAAKVGFDARHFIPVALAQVELADAPVLEPTDWQELVRSVDAAVHRAGAAIFATLRTGISYGVLGVDEPAHHESAVEGLRRAVATSAARSRAASVNVISGPRARTWRTLANGLREVAAATPYAMLRPLDAAYDTTVPDLERLVWSLRERAEVQEFVTARLAPIVEHDAHRPSKLLPTLVAFCKSGGSKAETARALHIERPSLYDRLARIEKLLGVSLGDPDAFVGLQLAVIASRMA